MQLNSGIYRLKSIVDNRSYIGSAVDFNKRKNLHYHTLRNNKHKNRYLQSFYNKYGEENLVFEILIRCPKEYLIKAEQWFIDNTNDLINLCKTAYSPLGVKRTEEYKEKMRVSKTGQLHSKETREKMSLSHKKHSTDFLNRVLPLLTGENHPKSKLSSEDVIRIKELLNTTNLTMIEIGNKFNISKSCINNIKRGVNRKNN